MILSHIVAASKNRVIGKEGQLPWKIPEDLKYFREKTKGHCIIMGRKTWQSLPGALSGRLNVVVSRDPSLKADGAMVVPTIEEALRICEQRQNQYGEEVFIVGGGEIYKQTMDRVDRIYLTLIDQEIEGDAFYPDVELKDFRLVNKSDRTDPFPFSFLVYERKR